MHQAYPIRIPPWAPPLATLAGGAAPAPATARYAHLIACALARSGFSARADTADPLNPICHAFGTRTLLLDPGTALEPELAARAAETARRVLPGAEIGRREAAWAALMLLGPTLAAPSTMLLQYEDPRRAGPGSRFLGRLGRTMLGAANVFQLSEPTEMQRFAARLADLGMPVAPGELAPRPPASPIVELRRLLDGGCTRAGFAVPIAQGPEPTGLESLVRGLGALAGLRPAEPCGPAAGWAGDRVWWIAVPYRRRTRTEREALAAGLLRACAELGLARLLVPHRELEPCAAGAYEGFEAALGREALRVSPLVFIDVPDEYAGLAPYGSLRREA